VNRGASAGGVRRARSTAAGSEQYRVCAPDACFVDLVGIDDEILAQHRQLASFARLLQVGWRALEERPVGEHAQARGAVPRVGRGDVGRYEVLAQHATARAGLLDFGNHRGLVRR
jgi:hypothetical protein